MYKMMMQFCSCYYSSVVCTANRAMICVTVIPRRGKWTPPNEKLRKDIEALRRWRQENTKLFGPILKTKKIVPLGKKKSKRQQTEKIVVGKDLDDWFREHYESKIPSRDLLHEPCKQGLIAKDSVDLHANISEHFEIETENTSSGDVISEKASDKGADKRVLNDILKCKITADSSTQLQSLQSCLLHSPFPTKPTVTGILAKTRSPESQFYLDRWKAQMIAELGEEGFKKYQTETLQKGVDLHSCIQQYLSGATSVQPQPDNTGHWSSVQPVLAKVTEVQAVETRVTHPYLNYAGTFDCVATYEDTVCLIDWKTSKKAKPHLSSTFDYPLQVCAYIGAYNADPDNQLKLDNGLVVVAYGDGSPAHAHLMTRDQCDYYWRQWLDKLYQYWGSVLFPEGSTNG